MRKSVASEIVLRLKRAYPDAGCSLDFRTPIQVVVATLLSAQSTDDRVNKTTPTLFRKYRSIKAFANAEQVALEGIVKPVGLYRSKAGNIIALARKLISDFNSRVPTTVKELETLPGIGRKSANVIRGELTGQGEGIAVDTHVKRLSYRLGLSKQRDPGKIEQDLLKLVPQEDWVLVSHLLIYHGRAVCNARQPRCDECVLVDLCPRRGVDKAQRKSSSAKTSASKT